MKSVVAAIIVALATVQAFSPSPVFVARRATTVVGSTKLYGYKSSKSSQYLENLEQDQMMSPIEGMPDNNNMMAEPYNEEEELSETQKLLKKVKESGTAGVISYALWELGFWALSVPVCIIGYKSVTG